MSDTLSNKSVSLLQPTKFGLTFSRIPDVVYFCQKVNIPEIKLPIAKQPTPFITRNVAGSKIEYGLLKISFLVEETLVSWDELHKWMKDIGNETSYDNYKDLNRLNGGFQIGQQKFPDAYSDATITILNTQNIPTARLNFKDAFPVFLSALDFDATSIETTIVCAATFGFFYYELQKIPG